MDFAISSVAGRVATIHGLSVSYFDADEPESRFTSSLEQIPYLFADDYDFTVIKRTSEDEALSTLLSSWNVDRGLRMLQLLLDFEEDSDIRLEAAACLQSLLSTQHTQIGIENFVSAVPLTVPTDWDDVTAVSAKYHAVREFLARLATAQFRIGEVRAAWLNVPDDLFVNSSAKFKFELQAILKGAFRRLVFEDRQLAILECHMLFAKLPNGRQIVSAWTTPLKRQHVRRADDLTASVQVEAEEKEVFIPWERERYSGRELYGNALQQQVGIRTRLQEGDLINAGRFANELVRWQLEHGGSEFAAKSLCAIAQHAKRYGRYDLQLEWVKWATEIAPNDSRALGQAGDAYLQLWKLDEAKVAYEAAKREGNENFGEIGLAKILRASGRFEQALEAFAELKVKYGTQESNSRAWSGYAEVLRELSRFEDALEAYESAHAAYPEECGIWCGKAAVLVDMGRLREALAQYESASRDFPTDIVPLCGRADTLKQMGRLDDALLVYNDAITHFPEEPIAVCGKADVLRVRGDFELAIREYKHACTRFPFDPAAFSGYAQTLRDYGHLEEASAAYATTVKQFPFDARCRNGRANILKAIGKFEDALQEYERNVRDFPYNLYALSGRAHLLKELGYPERALEAYDSIIARRPDHPGVGPAKAAILGLLGRFDEAEELVSVEAPSSLTEWVAYHVRGMIYLRQGRLDVASRVFTYGLKHTPFFKERRFFESALAACEIRRGNFESAYKLLEEPYGNVGQLLKLHACSELGKLAEAREILAAANDNVVPPLRLLRNEIAAQFGLSKGLVRHNKAWIADMEAEILLEAA